MMIGRKRSRHRLPTRLRGRWHLRVDAGGRNRWAGCHFSWRFHEHENADIRDHFARACSKRTLWDCDLSWP